MQITKEMLIADWEEIEAQLREMDTLRQRKAALEAFGLAAFGWKPGEEANPPVETRVRFRRIVPPEPSGGSIDYTASARQWWEGLTVASVKTPDFVQWLEYTYPLEEINRNSINAPLRTLVNEGKLTVIRVGEGRRPTEYGVPKNITEEFDEEAMLG